MVTVSTIVEPWILICGCGHVTATVKPLCKPTVKHTCSGCGEPFTRWVPAGLVTAIG